jgi:glycerophosphoryl diester phosphodiesterase
VFQATVDAEADYFKVDVRTTSDGQFVLMHDATVDRMTNGQGAVRDMTFEQIRALDAGAKFASQSQEPKCRLLKRPCAWHTAKSEST